MSLTDAADPATPGENLRLTVRVENLNPSNEACGTVVAFVLDGATSLTQLIGCSVKPVAGRHGASDCPLGQIGPGSNVEAILEVAIAPEARGQISTGASVSTTTGDPNSANDAAVETTALEPRATLALSGEASTEQAVPGDELTYFLTATNDAGPSTAHETELSIQLPPGSTLLSTTGCLEDPEGVPTCSLGAVPVGGLRQAEITIQVGQRAGNLRFAATATTTALDSDASDQSVVLETPVTLESRVGQGHSPSIAADLAGAASEAFAVVWQRPAPAAGGASRGGEDPYTKTFRQAGNLDESKYPDLAYLI
ncbi:MAG: hypothetical protein AAF725_08370, partial [Acidobacteriota bacterium]